MTKTRKQQQREIAAREMAEMTARLEAALGGKVICEKCGATLDDVADVCSAPLSELCDGFVVIEIAKHPRGNAITEMCPEEQIARCRAIAGVIA